MNAINNLSPQQLRQAADIQEQIFTLRIELDQLLGTQSSIPIAMPGKKRRLSAQGLANIRAGARKRWAKFHGGNGTGTKSLKHRSKMSSAGRAAIAARMRARWAAAKRAGRNAL